MTLLNNITVVVANCSFSEVVEDTIVASQVDRNGVHQVLPGIGSVGPDPLVIHLG